MIDIKNTPEQVAAIALADGDLDKFITRTEEALSQIRALRAEVVRALEGQTPTETMDKLRELYFAVNRIGEQGAAFGGEL